MCSLNIHDLTRKTTYACSMSLYFSISYRTFFLKGYSQLFYSFSNNWVFFFLKLFEKKIHVLKYICFIKSLKLINCDLHLFLLCLKFLKLLMFMKNISVYFNTFGT